MPLQALFQLSQESPVHIVLVDACEPASLTLASLLAPLREAARSLSKDRLQLHLVPAATFSEATLPGSIHLCLLLGDVAAVEPSNMSDITAACRKARYWGGVGAGVLWLARYGVLNGLRAALPWSQYAEAGDLVDQLIPIPQLYDLDQSCLTCCGGAAGLDFGLALVGAIYGSDLQAEIVEVLNVERVRGAGDRQKMAMQARFGALQPKLAEAVALMQANLEEPLSTDDIANLVGISRRQLERQFKQYLASVPSRYYLELRLQRARQLLLESHHSIVQVGLMCGFSSGSHFSTAYGGLFGITPREERQRKLQPHVE